MKAAIVLVVLFMMVSAIWLGAQTLPVGNQQHTENALVKYLRADASLRQSYALPPDAAEKLQKAVESPLDAEDERLVAAADEALVELRHGAAIERCDWVMRFARLISRLPDWLALSDDWVSSHRME
jgi:hypothetical protein